MRAVVSKYDRVISHLGWLVAVYFVFRGILAGALGITNGGFLTLFVVGLCYIYSQLFMLLYIAKHDRRRSKLDLKNNVLVIRKRSRPKRDRAIVFVFLSTGLRREELREVNINQLEPRDPDKLRTAKIARLRRVRGKGETEREVFLSYDARQALADYLESERIEDADEHSQALFLTAKAIPARKPDGRMSLQSINQMLHRIGEFHDQSFPDRPISPLQPHALRHTFAFRLVDEMIRIKGGVDESELERRLGHRSERYIKIYAHGPEDVSQGYIERL